MSTTETFEEPRFESLEYDQRYYVQTAQNSIESLGHIVAEAGSNEDEAITRRGKRDATDDRGTIRFAYDPDAMLLTVTGDGDGMTASQMRSRLKPVGAKAREDARRGFFHRGIREVFLAMGGGHVVSIGRTEDGRDVLSEAIFDPEKGMALLAEDSEPTDEQRAELGLDGTGTQVEIPVRRFASKKSRLYTFGSMEQQIRDCVGIRPVLTDPEREVVFEYGGEPPRRLRFEYPQGEVLVNEREAVIRGQSATFWARATDKPIKGSRSARQLRRNGILVRGERAAYEVAVGDKLAQDPAMNRVFGELRIDGIEQLQREADAKGTDESQLVYKTDRSGLNPEHPIVEAIYAYIDETLGPLVSALESREDKKEVTPDMRRQLQKLARVINDVIDADSATDIEDVGGKQTATAGEAKQETEPPTPPDERSRGVEDGINFVKDRIFIESGKSRTVEVWFDSSKVAAGTEVSLDCPITDVVQHGALSGTIVPDSAGDGIAQLDLTLKAGNSEGRQEVLVSAGGYSALLVVHVRFPRASGFISQIIPKDLDWEVGSALWNPSSGVVEVFVGRPEFKDAAKQAKIDGDEDDPWQDPRYRQLVVESVREAALWEAAVRRAEVEWDDLPYEERQESNAFHNLARTQFQELDYLLRAKLLHAFARI